MNLRELQSNFARLVTDDAFRRHVREGAAGAHADGDLQALAAERGVELHAETLKRKRLAFARIQLPLTALTLHDRFASLFRRFAGGHSLIANDRYVHDAIKFLNWLESTDCEDSPAQEFDRAALASAIRIDRSDLLARAASFFFRIRFADGRVLPESWNGPRKRFILIWFRRSERHKVHRLRITFPWG